MTDIPELTTKELQRAIPARVRKRLMLGQIESGGDISALRRFIGLTQAQFAQAMAISVHTLRNWEQGRRHPDGPAHSTEKTKVHPYHSMREARIRSCSHSSNKRHSMRSRVGVSSVGASTPSSLMSTCP